MTVMNLGQTCTTCKVFP